jgi:hypothetical protein
MVTRMRAFAVGSLAALAIFAAASRVPAASVDITVSLVPGTATWDLTLDIAAPALGVHSVALTVSNSLGPFTLAIPGEQPICFIPEGCYGTPFGFNLVLLGFATPIGPGQVLLGQFNSEVTSAAIVQVLPGDDAVGGTVFDLFGNALDYSIRVVPEPPVSGLLPLLAVLGVARRLNS